MLVATGGAGPEVTPLLRLAAAPFADVLLAPTRLPGAGSVVQGALALAALVGHDLAHDRAHVGRILAGLPTVGAQEAFIRTLRSVVDWRGQVVSMLDRIYLAGALPTLVVWGDRDGVIPVAHAHRAHAAVPGSRLEIFAGAGHFPHHADPDRFVALVEDFVATTRPGRHDPRRWRRLLRGAAAA